MLLADKLRLAEVILERQLLPEKEQIIMNFLFYYVNFEFQETKITFENKINLLTKKNNTEMTIQEIIIGQEKLKAKRLALKEAKEDEITRLIRKQGLTDEQIVEFAEAPISLVKRVRKRTERIT